MPAGPAPYPQYWAALKELNVKLRLDDPSGRGVMALLDLQARISDELHPDYLLIDARTGVTELGGLATSILADTVVCMFVANQESLDGTLEVVKALKASPRLANQRPIRVISVLSRTPMFMIPSLRFDEGIESLREMSEDRRLFILPHDDMASENRVGEELQKANLDLFESLFARASMSE